MHIYSHPYSDLHEGSKVNLSTQESAQREALKEARRVGEEANDMEKAQDFGRLRTMKVQQAVKKEEEEEMRVRMRQAQRKMKGVKLQYTDSGRVTFDDVAGVPGAKVHVPLHFVLSDICSFTLLLKLLLA